jgi:hypothetical protein
LDNLKNISSFFNYLWQGTSNYQPSNISKKSNVIIFVLYLNYHYWDIKNYRSDTYQKDMIDNLKNVIIPRTPIIFSWLVQFKITYLISVFIYLLFYNIDNVDNWFLYWRINCILSTHDEITNGSCQYKYENKYDFLKDYKDKIKTYPVINDCEYIYVVKKLNNVATEGPLLDYDVVIKDPNVEGGMGIYFFNKNKYWVFKEKPQNVNYTEYKNIFYGNNKDGYIIQQKMKNPNYLKLNNSCPLSTIRIVSSYDNCNVGNGNDNIPKIWARVFRKGDENAKTDHKCTLFNVTDDGKILTGCRNQNWYSLFGSNEENMNYGSEITIDNFNSIENKIKKYHKIYFKDIPIIGWDVALTDNNWNILEINLSCNFFCGISNDNKKEYFDFVDKKFIDINKYHETCVCIRGMFKDENEYKDENNKIINNLKRIYESIKNIKIYFLYSGKIPENFLNNFSKNFNNRLEIIKHDDIYFNGINEVLKKTNDTKFKYIMFVSLDVQIKQYNISELLNYFDKDTILVGPKLQYHNLKNKKINNHFLRFNGLTIPWNTCAIWDLEYLKNEKFEKIGGVDGMEEVKVIYKCLSENKKVKLINFGNDIGKKLYDPKFDNEEKKRNHEKKINTKISRTKTIINTLNKNNNVEKSKFKIYYIKKYPHK